METPNRYLAVQMEPRETTQGVVRLVLGTAHDVRLLFWALEVLDVIEVGGTSFLRLRTDIPDLRVLIDRLLTRGRSVIAVEDGNYVLQRANGQRGKIPMTSMHGSPKLGQQRTVRGTLQWAAGLAS